MTGSTPATPTAITVTEATRAAPATATIATAKTALTATAKPIAATTTATAPLMSHSVPTPTPRMPSDKLPQTPLSNRVLPLTIVLNRRMVGDSSFFHGTGESVDRFGSLGTA